VIISPVHFPIYPFAPHSRQRNSFFDSSFFFSRGSWALAAGIMAIAKKRKNDAPRVWLPDYVCREPIEVLQRFSLSIHFYPIQKNLEPDWEHCARSCADDGPPDVFVLVHYFGFPNAVIEAKNFSKEWGVDLVEDCAHVMHPFGMVGSSGSCSIFSPWKFYPIPLLGVLSVAEPLRGFVTSSPARWEIASVAHWWLKREVQRALAAMRVPWYQRREQLPTPHSLGDPQPNAFAHRLFRNLLGAPADRIARRRRESYQSLAMFFRAHAPEMMIFGGLPSGAIPYYFPLVMKEPAKKFVARLVAHGVPATQWPTLPEVVAVDRSRPSYAHEYADRLVLLPIHHNVSPANVEYMTSVICSVMTI